MENSENKLKLITSPVSWDTLALEIKTYRLDINGYQTRDELKVRNYIYSETKVSERSLFYTRINSNSLELKKLLTAFNFYNCETQLHLHRGGLSMFSVPKELGTRRLPLSLALDEDYIEVSAAAASTFKYSRFHEDPFCARDKADKRMELWCQEMHKRKTPLLIFRDKNKKIASFIFFDFIDSKRVELLLGGSLQGKGMLTPFFWASFLEYFQRSGISSISTRISASNITIANVYFLFGFSIQNTYFDYHKIVEPS